MKSTFVRVIQSAMCFVSERKYFIRKKEVVVKRGINVLSVYIFFPHFRAKSGSFSSSD